MNRNHPLWHLFLARVREFQREPEVIFWVFGFPVLLALGLGIAFRNKPPDVLSVGVVAGAEAGAVREALEDEPGLDVRLLTEAEAGEALRLDKVALVVVPGWPVTYRLDPTRPDSALARQLVDDRLQRAAGRTDPLPVAEARVTEPGSRYIDFLIPGLLGMNIMSGGMWGVGFALTEMRSRKLLKRFVATPMRRSHFLAAMMASRMMLVFLELALMLILGRLVFDMVIVGSLAVIVWLVVLGSFTFSSLGLLVGSRAARIETVSGLINLVMLPMFVFSGVFFSADRFPAFLQPAIRLLPLTALNDALRAVILEGAAPASQSFPIAILLAWGGLSFAGALRFFRWV